MKKNIFYFLFFISICFIIVLKKIGVFDSSTIKIDDFYIKKPFLYRNFNSNSSIKLKSHDSNMISFFKFDGSYIINYSIKKIIDKHKYNLQSKINNLNLDKCYILKDNIQNIVKIEVYKYPYIINFNDISEERKENFLKQVCKKVPLTELNISKKLENNTPENESPLYDFSTGVLSVVWLLD